MSNLLSGVIKVLVNVVVVFVTAFGAAYGAGGVDFGTAASLAIAAVIGNLSALFQNKPGTPPVA
jgi:hypothetical protein